MASRQAPFFAAPMPESFSYRRELRAFLETSKKGAEKEGGKKSGESLQVCHNERERQVRQGGRAAYFQSKPSQRLVNPP